MLAVALGSIAVESIAAMGLEANCSDAAIATIDPLLANAFERDLIAKSLRGELFAIWQVFREIDRLDFNVWERVGRDVDGWMWVYGLPVFDAWRAYDEMTYLRIMEAAIEQSMLPFYEQTGMPEAQTHSLDWRTPMSSTMIPNFMRHRYQVTDMRAQFGLARIALALTRYKRDTGVYPETLDALVPTYLAEIPEDPCSGNRMPYRVGPEGYLLSSTGWNSKDDVLKTDGKQTKTINGFTVAPSDDIVWPLMNKFRQW